MPAHGSSRHDRSVVLSALFAVAAVAVAALIITHQPSHAPRMTGATGPAQLTATAAGLPRGGRGHPLRPAAGHQPPAARRSAAHPGGPAPAPLPPNASACRISPAHPGRYRDWHPVSRAGREPGCGGPAGTGVD